MFVTATSAGDPTKSGSALVTLLPGITGGTAGDAAKLIAASLCRRVSAGGDQYVQLSCNGSQCTASASLQGSALTYTLEPGFSLTYGWSLVSGPAPVQFSNAASAATSVTVTAPGA